MARSIAAYSRLVFWLKVTLPILALAILSTLFLLSRNIDFEGSLPFSDKVNDPQMTRPEYSGVTTDGAAVTVTADQARPGKTVDDPATAQTIDAVYSLGSRRVSVSANQGSVDMAAGRATLTGAAHLKTSDGYDFTAPSIAVDLNRTDVEATGGIKGQAPLGDITAETMHLTGAPGAHQLVFKTRVRLVYRPES